MGWHKLGSKTLNDVGDDFSVNVDNEESYQIMSYAINSGTIDPHLRVNNNSSSDYAYRVSDNDSADTTATSQSFLLIGEGSGAFDQFSVMYMCNVDGEEKLAMSFAVGRGTAGEANPPDRREGISKFIGTEEISSLTLRQAGGGDYDVNTNISIIGTTDDLDKVTQ